MMGWTPTHSAAQSGDLEKLTALICSGKAKEDKDVRMRDRMAEKKRK